LNQRDPALEHIDCPQCLEEAAMLQQTPNLPGFAQITEARLKPISPRLLEEEQKIILKLAKEHIFFYSHILVFLFFSAVGLGLATKCYVEFNGDAVSRFMMAAVPVLLINTTSCTSLICVHGTKRKIVRLKEQLHHIRLQIEYEYLM
jgi:hypothetical protein